MRVLICMSVVRMNWGVLFQYVKFIIALFMLRISQVCSVTVPSAWLLYPLTCLSHIFEHFSFWHRMFQFLLKTSFLKRILVGMKSRQSPLENPDLQSPLENPDLNRMRSGPLVLSVLSCSVSFSCPWEREIDIAYIVSHRMGEMHLSLYLGWWEWEERPFLKKAKGHKLLLHFKASHHHFWDPGGLPLNAGILLCDFPLSHT